MASDKQCAIEFSVNTPYMMNMALGGRGCRWCSGQTDPVANFCSYRVFFISGKATSVMVAAVARLEAGAAAKPEAAISSPWPARRRR